MEYPIHKGHVPRAQCKHRSPDAHSVAPPPTPASKILRGPRRQPWRTKFGIEGGYPPIYLQKNPPARYTFFGGKIPMGILPREKVAENRQRHRWESNPSAGAGRPRTDSDVPLCYVRHHHTLPPAVYPRGREPSPRPPTDFEPRTSRSDSKRRTARSSFRFEPSVLGNSQESGCGAWPAHSSRSSRNTQNRASEKPDVRAPTWSRIGDS